MSTWSNGCGHVTAGFCPACAPVFAPTPAACPTCGRNYNEVSIAVTVPVETAMQRLAAILREFAEKEPGPVREHLTQIAEVVDGSR